MPAFQVAYGLQIAVEAPIPGLLSQPKQRRPDIHIRLKGDSTDLPLFFDSASGFSRLGANSGERAEAKLRVVALAAGQYYGLTYPDGVRFAVERGGREIWGDWPDGYALEDACTYLVGPIMAFALRLQGVTCLHASAIAVEGRAIVLMGAAGSGKSTTAAAFAKMGFPVLVDDVVALSEKGDRPFVQPGYPRVNLWPDSVRELFGSEEALPPITPTWGKRFLPLDPDGNYRFQAEALPLGGIYVLGDRNDTLATTRFERATGSSALMLLVANAYGNHFLDEQMQTRDLGVFARVAAQIPIHKVRPPDQPRSLYALCEAIAASARGIEQERIPGAARQ